MGRTANIAKDLLELSNQFKPQELNEGNVQAIFNRCLATKDSTNLLRVILFEKKYGYDEDFKPLAFDRDVIVKNEKNIRYLYGQLQDVHKVTHLITPMSSTINYKGENWTQNKGIILSFLHLGQTQRFFQPFIKITYNSSAVFVGVRPTLSPKDPAFPAWWEEHKSEWEA